jgi:hypothetical protein
MMMTMVIILNQKMTLSMVALFAAVAAITPLFYSTSLTAAAATTTTNSTTLLYDNPTNGIQIRYPQDWAYIDSGSFFTGGPFAAVIFMPAMDALRFGMMMPLLQQQQDSSTGATDKLMPTTSVTTLILQLPFGNMDVRLLVDYILSSSSPEDRDYELIRTNPNAVLSGIPAYEYEAVTIPSEPG